jgi:hypothetical protein
VSDTTHSNIPTDTELLNRLKERGIMNDQQQKTHPNQRSAPIRYQQVNKPREKSMSDEKKENRGSRGETSSGIAKHLATGEISDLGTNVYIYGSRNQGDIYVKTTEAIGDYVGRIHGKAMRMLVLRGKEMPPKKPTAPSTTLKQGEPITAEWREYDKGLDFYNKKIDQYKEDKAKVFIVIMGQCTSMMRNKVEGVTDTRRWRRMMTLLVY